MTTDAGEYLAELPTGKRPLYLRIGSGWARERFCKLDKDKPLSRPGMELRLFGHAAHVLVYMGTITLSRMSRVHGGQLSEQQFLRLFCCTGTTKHRKITQILLMQTH